MFVVTMVVLSLLVLGIGVARVRVWNPSRELRIRASESEATTPAVSDAVPVSWRARAPRRVWDNPILWREVCTWGFGR